MQKYTLREGLVLILLIVMPLSVGFAIKGVVDHQSHVYRITDQRNGYEVGITCQNSGDPAVAGNFDGMLVVSCGKDAK